MRCSNCGKNIPFKGNICPYCNCDKSKDQFLHLLGITGGILVGFLSFLVSSPCTGPLIGLIIGAAVYVILSVAMAQKK
jgi:cytochrome c biogenesis protein CcdA